MTKVEITIQNGKVTWIEQNGERLPNKVWESINVAIANSVAQGDMED